ncbi:MAG TPA: hypothetical protein VJP59_03400 [Gemmatimonadota bacterium]|nr:hypothetical protein [Gemmatimonadota bacterium]
MTSLQREVIAKLRAYWRAEPNGKGYWGYCPVCRHHSLGVGTWGHESHLRLTCWNEECDAGEVEVLAALGVRPDPWSRQGMLVRVERLIYRLEWQLRHLLDPPDIEVPGERRAA